MLPMQIVLIENLRMDMLLCTLLDPITRCSKRNSCIVTLLQTEAEIVATKEIKWLDQVL